jgi:hypothetical protein
MDRKGSVLRKVESSGRVVVMDAHHPRYRVSLIFCKESDVVSRRGRVLEGIEAQ